MVEVSVHVSGRSINMDELESDAHLLDMFDKERVAGTYTWKLNVTIGDGTSALFLDRALLGMCQGEQKTFVVPPQLGFSMVAVSSWFQGGTLLVPQIAPGSTLIVAASLLSFRNKKRFMIKSGAMPPTPRATMAEHYQDFAMTGAFASLLNNTPTATPTMMAWPDSLTPKPTRAPTKHGKSC